MHLEEIKLFKTSLQLPLQISGRAEQLKQEKIFFMSDRSKKYILPISNMSSLLIVVLFLTGVYVGKFITLYFYGKMGTISSQKQNQNPHKLYRFIGLFLVLFSTIQGLRIWF